MITSVLIIVEMNEMIYIKVTSDRLCLCSAYPSLRYQSRHGSQHSPSLAEIQQIQQNTNTNTVQLNWTFNLCACIKVNLRQPAANSIADLKESEKILRSPKIFQLWKFSLFSDGIASIARIQWAIFLCNLSNQSNSFGGEALGPTNTCTKNVSQQK